MASTADDSRPLLERDVGNAAAEITITRKEHRQWVAQVLDSKKKHYFILTLVALDVSCLLADIFVSLVACDRDEKDAPWVDETQEGLSHAGLVFSSLFLLELLLTMWAFGLHYFRSWFNIFDAVVIIASFSVDLLTHGIIDEVASLVIILRLWRFVKIIEELSVGASERMEDMEMLTQELQRENAQLKQAIDKLQTSQA